MLRTPPASPAHLHSVFSQGPQVSGLSLGLRVSPRGSVVEESLQSEALSSSCHLAALCSQGPHINGASSVYLSGGGQPGVPPGGVRPGEAPGVPPGVPPGVRSQTMPATRGRPAVNGWSRDDGDVCLADDVQSMSDGEESDVEGRAAPASAPPPASVLSRRSAIVPLSRPPQQNKQTSDVGSPPGQHDANVNNQQQNDALQPSQPSHFRCRSATCSSSASSRSAEEHSEEQSGQGGGQQRETERVSSHRRSSVVVCPSSMAICPGDLFVTPYHLRTVGSNGTTDTFHLDLSPFMAESTQNISQEEFRATTKKGKTSLLKIFANHKSKECESLEDILTSVKLESFVDHQLGKSKERSWTAWFSKEELSAMSETEKKRNQSVWELFRAECVFLMDHLMVLKHVFLEPLKKVQVEGYLMFAEPDQLFGNIDELCCVSYAYCKEFLNTVCSPRDAEQEGSPSRCPSPSAYRARLTIESVHTLYARLQVSCSVYAAYHRYCLNYINALNYLEVLRRHDEWIEFEKWCYCDYRCKRLQLPDLLVAPMQHVMHMPVLLRDIRRRIPNNDGDGQKIIDQILADAELSLRNLDDKMKWLKNFEKLQEIQKQLTWPPVADMDSKVFIPDCLKPALSKQPCSNLVASPKRQFLHEGTLQVTTESGRCIDAHVFLFDDMLLVTKPKKGVNKKSPTYVVQRQPLGLDRCLVHDINSQEAAGNNLKHAFSVVSTNRFQQIIGVLTFQANSSETKSNWLELLTRAIDKWKLELNSRYTRAPRAGRSGEDSLSPRRRPRSKGHSTKQNGHSTVTSPLFPTAIVFSNNTDTDP